MILSKNVVYEFLWTEMCFVLPLLPSTSLSSNPGSSVRKCACYSFKICCLHSWLTLVQGGIKIKMINFPNWIIPHCQNETRLTSLACPFTVPTAPRWTACAQLNVSACRNAVTSCQLKSNLMHMKVF